jgi:voltage-gated potassium channel Kch
VLFLVLLLVTLVLFALFLGGSIVAQGYLYQAPADRLPVRALVVGWSQFGRLVMQHLDEFLVPGSSVHVQVDIDLVDPASVADLTLRNASVTVGAGRGGPEDLTSLAADDSFDQVIVLGYRDALGPSDADARTLLSLLALRMIWPKGGEHEVRIVAELVDQRNLAIATPVGIDDLIVSDALASLMMAQLSENVQLQSIFDDLFDPYGPVVTMRRAATIVPHAPVEWAHVVAGASAQDASAFGYRDGATGEVFMNPPKSKQVRLGGDDLVILVETRAAAPAAAAPTPAKRSRSTRTTKKTTTAGTR